MELVEGGADPVTVQQFVVRFGPPAAEKPGRAGVGCVAWIN
jgi:hypothetical protein